MAISDHEQSEPIGQDRPAQPERGPGQAAWPLEDEMLAGAATGELVECEGPYELADMRHWERERTVRAAVLREVLVGRQWPVHEKGVRLRGARISGYLDLDAATLRCPLSLDRCYLDADEAVCLDLATGSRIEMTGCHLPGLSAEMLTVKELDLSGSTFAGPVVLIGADIGGQLICTDARFQGRDEDGDAFVADRLKTGGSVFLDGVFTADGALHLIGADMGGQLVCSDADLHGRDEDGYALSADRLKTGGSVFLDGVSAADGAISLHSAQVGGSVKFSPAALAEVAFRAVGARIGGTLEWAPARQVNGHVSLEGAKVGELDDDWTGERAKTGYWPSGGRLHLNGFAYDRLGGEQLAAVDQRLKWLQGQYERTGTGWLGFAAQPYEQLATVYRRAGQDAEARKIAIARHADLRTYGSLRLYRKASNWLLDKTIKYGYQSWRAGGVLAFIYGGVWLLATIAQHTHGIVPVGGVKGLNPMPSAVTCTSSYPCFAPAGYAIDVVIPIINVHQEQYWGPNGYAWGYAWVTATWVATVLGWTLTTLLVAGLTGLARPGD